MKIKYKKYMKKLWELAGEIGCEAEKNSKNAGAYSEVYKKLSEALDEAEYYELIEYKEEE